MPTGMQKKAARKRAALEETKVFSVTLEVKIVVRADTREEAVLSAMEHNKISDRLESIRVTNTFCPAEGK